MSAIVWVVALSAAGAVGWRFRKFILHKVSGRTEIERICLSAADSKAPPATTTIAVERSVRASRALPPKLKKDLLSPPAEYADDASLSGTERLMTLLVTAKRMNTETPEFKRLSPVLHASLSRLVSVSHLLVLLQAARTPYDETNTEHEARLAHLWSVLRPDVRLSNRISDEWGEIGFQGKNPATDFRGMGLLGLEQLIAWAERYPADCRDIMRDCRTKRNWYSFAITSLNLTFDLFQLTSERKLNVVYYEHGATMDTFLRMHAVLFRRLNEAWTAANPANMMAWKSIHDPVLAAFAADAAAGRIRLR